MALESGAKLGPYEILTPIGAGDLETYKAADTRVNRSVTLRLLPREFCQDPEIRSRLKSRIQSLASLKHPVICTPVDVGQDNETGYMVSESVEGEMLAQRLQQGPLEIAEAIKIAIAIADALDRAHRHGIVHRGLNPSNIVLTADGPKLLDFGLANLHETNLPGSVSSLPTLTVIPAASAAVPAHAAPYLAPEQWTGKETDARTDIFALGTILYEMLAGKPAFEGKTPALLVAAIETIDPEPLSTVQPAMPPALEFVVGRCLAKEPRQRMQTAKDLLNQLQWIAESSMRAGVPLAASAKKRDRLTWIIAAVMALLALIMAPGVYRYLQGSAEPELARFQIPTLGGGIGSGPPMTISPDGRWIARSLGTGPGLDSILLDSASRQLLLPANLITQPFWSPDSQWIAFFEEGFLKKANIAGGPAQNICEAPAPFGSGTWNSDGVILFSGGGVLQRVMASGGVPAPVTALDQSRQETEHLAPFFLPDGNHYIFLAVSSDPSQTAIYVGSLDTEERTFLFASESKAIYAAPGYILFTRADAIFARAFDTRRLALAGEPVRIADGLVVANDAVATSSAIGTSAALYTSAVHFAVSQTGVLTYRTGDQTQQSPGPAPNPVGERTLVWFNRSGAQTGQVGGPGPYAGVDLSPDGKRVAVHVHEGSGGGDIWFFDSSQGRMQRLTFDARQENSAPLWSPDGTRLAFASRRNGKDGLYVKLVDGTAAEELIIESNAIAGMSWSPDGNFLVYSLPGQTGGDIWAVPLSGDRKPTAILESPSNETNPQVSPDGKWLAYTSNETGRNEIYIKPFPEGPGKWQVTTEGGQWPRWRGDSQELFYNPLGPAINAVDIHVAGSSVQPGVPRVLFGINNPSPPHADYHRYAVSQDGQRFLIPQLGTGTGTGGSTADQLATMADQGQSSSTPNTITVILNWTQLLKPK